MVFDLLDEKKETSCRLIAIDVGVRRLIVLATDVRRQRGAPRPANGTLDIADSPLGGARFTLRLPR